MIAQSEVTSIMHYSPDTGVFTRLTAPAKRVDLIGTVAGSVSKRDGYRRIFIRGKSYLAHRLAWIYMHGTAPSIDIDHIDGNRSNNKISNLRAATRSENVQNLKRAKRDNISSGVLGVCFDARMNKFRAAITLDKKRTHLGYFETAQIAHEAYLQAKRKIHAGCTI